MDQLKSGGTGPTKDEEVARHENNTQGMAGKAAAGGVTTVLGTLTSFALSLIGLVVITRLLTKEDFGLFGMVTVLSGLAAMFIDFGLGRALIHKDEITDGQISGLFWINAIVGLVMASVFAMLTPVIVWLYQEPRLMAINLAMASVFLFSALGVQHQALLQREMRFKKLALVQPFAMGFGVIAGILVALAGGGYWALVVQRAVLQVVTVIMLFSFSGWLPGRPAPWNEIRDLVKFGTHVFSVQMVNYFSRNTDNFLLGYFYGPSVLGLYARAYTLVMLPAEKVNAPCGGVIIPVLSRLRSEPKRYAKAYLDIISAISLLLTPLCILMFLDAEEAVPLLLGEEWKDLVPVFWLLAPTCLMAVTRGAEYWLYVSWGHVERYTKWTMIQTPLLIVAICLGVPWGGYGVAAAASIATVLLKPVAFAVASPGTPVQLCSYLDRVFTPIILSLLAAAPILTLNSLSLLGDGIFKLVIQSVAYLLVVSSVYVFGPTKLTNAQVLSNISSLLMKKFR